MTDEQIIKDFECCMKQVSNCCQCTYSDNTDLEFDCEEALGRDVGSLINRQKAEIERLKRKNTILSKNADTAFQDGLDENRDLFKKEIEPEIRNEAIKKFAERLCKGRVENDPVVIAVKSELKEMTEAKA